MGALAKTIVSEVTTLLPQCKIELSLEGNLEGRWDAARIGQLLSNLLANAGQHGDISEPVNVRVNGGGADVFVHVQNKGTPISAQAQKTLFLPLRQAPVAEGERRTGSSGLGLGLYIAREIAVAHGGVITVTSDREATTFSARIPRRPPVTKDRRAGSPPVAP
jgi:signal transduction histidine kinase